VSRWRSATDASGVHRPHRGQGRSYKGHARSEAGAGILWEGSSDPDSGGGQCATLGQGPVGNIGCLPQLPRSGLERSLWERKDRGRRRAIALSRPRPLLQGDVHDPSRERGFCGRGLL